MAGSTLDAIASGTRVFLDATVFIYHFTGQSLECRRLLERCERGELGGVTCTAAVAEVTHRLMMIEAVSHGLVTAGNVARTLHERPDVVRQLHVYQTQIDRIALMGVDVAPVDLDAIARSAHFRRRSTASPSTAPGTCRHANLDSEARAHSLNGRLVPGSTGPGPELKLGAYGYRW